MQRFLRMGDARHKRRYPKGPRVGMTPQWKEAVRAAMDTRDWSHQQLADAIDSDKSTIGKLFKPDQVSSKLVGAISRVLEIPTPDEMKNALAAKLAQLPQEARDRILALVDWILSSSR